MTPVVQNSLESMPGDSDDTLPGDWYQKSSTPPGHSGSCRTQVWSPNFSRHTQVCATHPAKGSTCQNFISREQISPLWAPWDTFKLSPGYPISDYSSSTFFSLKWPHLHSPHGIITNPSPASLHSLIKHTQVSVCPPRASLFLSNERAILKNAWTTDLPFFREFSNVQTPQLQKGQSLLVWLSCTALQGDGNLKKELAYKKEEKEMKFAHVEGV